MKLKTFALGLLIVCVLLCVYHYPVFFQGKDFFNSDHNYYFEPFTRYLSEAIRHGRLPMWNSLSYCGMSQLANPSPGIFYLPNVFFLLLPYSKALSAVIFFHQLLCFVAGYFLLVLMGFSFEAAFFAGVCLALNGYVFSSTSNYTLPATFAFGLLSFYAYLSFIAKTRLWGYPRARACYFVVGALSTHFMIMAGRPEIYLPFCLGYGGLIALLLFAPQLLPLEGLAFKAQELSFKARIWLCVFIALAVLLGILMAMPTLLPVYEWTNLSPRAHGLNLEQVFQWSANWYDFFGIVFCQVLGDLQRPGASLAHFVATRSGHYPFLASAYLGPVAVSFFFIGLFTKRRGLLALLLAVALLVTAFALGKYAPVSEPVLKAIPLFATLRYPVKLLILLICPFSIIAALGFEEYLAKSISVNLKKFLLGLWASLVLLFLALFLAAVPIADCFNHPQPLYFATIGKGSLPYALIGLMVALLIYYEEKLPFDKDTGKLCLLAALVGSMVVPATRFGLSVVEKGFYERPSYLAERLKELSVAAEEGLGGKQTAGQSSNSDSSSDSISDSGLGSGSRGRLLCMYFDPLTVPDNYKSISKPQANSMQYARELLLPITNMDYHWPEIFGYEAAETADYRKFYLRAYHRSNLMAGAKSDKDLSLAALVRITSCRFVSTQAYGDKAKRSYLNPQFFQLVDDEPENHLNVRLYKVKAPQERAYIATCARLKKHAAIETLETLRANEAVIEIEHFTKPIAEPYLRLVAKAITGVGPGFEESPMPGGGDLNKPAGQLPANLSDGKELRSCGEVRFLSDKPEKVSLSVNMLEEGFLILQDRYYPGWQVFIDAQPASIFRANGFMRGVYLARGSHLVEFAYQPESFFMGIYLALGALSVLLLALSIYLWLPCKRLVHFLSTGK
jgi:hypothetical protein